MSLAGPLAVLAAAAAPVPDASPDKIDTPITAVPKSFVDCASAYARKLAADETIEARFDCALRHFRGHPGFDESSYASATAGVHAAGVANLYVDEILVPMLSEQLQDDPKELTRGFLLRGYVRSQRAAGQSLCDIYYDMFSGGTIRSVMGSGCALGNADRLVEALLRLQATIAPR